jgi:DNA-binding CsgD family transcriptional regulator
MTEGELLETLKQQQENSATSSTDSSKEVQSNLETLPQSLANIFFGFGAAVGNSVVIILYNIKQIHYLDVMQFAAVVALLPIALLVMLMLCKYRSDYLTSKTGNKLVVAFVVVGSIGSIVFTMLGFCILGAALPLFAIAFTVVLFSGCLLKLPRNTLAILINVSFMYAGLLILFCSSGYEYCLIVICIATLVSTIFTLLFATHFDEYKEKSNAEDSKKNIIKLKGNNTTLFLIGFMVGLVAIVFVVASTFEMALFVIGAAVLVASLISFVANDGFDERKYKNFMLKSMAIASCSLLLIQFFPNIVQLVILCVYLAYAFMNLIIVINAIVETARFDLLSLVWLFGSEGSMLAGGLTCGVLVVIFVMLLEFYGVQNAFNIVVMVNCFVCAALQMRINYQVYPFEPIFETNEPEATPELKSAGRQKALWHSKIETACTLYHLSPREKEVLHILLKGRDTKYIMEKFVVSQSTAKTHIYNIYRKFDIHSRQELLDFIEDMVVTDSQSEDSAD